MDTEIVETQTPYGYCHCGCGQKTSIATSTNRRTGRIKGQPNRYIHCHYQHLSRPHYPVNYYEEQDTGFSTPCWIWQGHVGSGGYGQLREQSAYVYHYEKQNGRVPEGCVVHHLCHVKACVNPDHLEAVSRRVNGLAGFYPPFTSGEDMAPKTPKSFRLSAAALDRLDQLSKDREMSRTMVLEQLLKQEVDRTSTK